MAAASENDLYEPLSTDFLIPTNRDIGAIALPHDLAGTRSPFVNCIFNMELKKI